VVLASHCLLIFSTVSPGIARISRRGSSRRFRARLIRIYSRQLKQCAVRLGLLLAQVADHFLADLALDVGSSPGAPGELFEFGERYAVELDPPSIPQEHAHPHRQPNHLCPWRTTLRSGDAPVVCRPVPPPLSSRTSPGYGTSTRKMKSLQVERPVAQTPPVDALLPGARPGKAAPFIAISMSIIRFVNVDPPNTRRPITCTLVQMPIETCSTRQRPGRARGRRAAGRRQPRSRTR
jgi:hypothetical protein